MGIGWAYLIHKTLFVGVMRMENKVVGGQWLGPVDGFPCVFHSLFISQSCTFFWDQQPQ
jgi:hypothetical protein